jgi:hypothetical protein
MGLFQKEKQTDTRLLCVYDIGSASVSGAVVSVEADGRPRILYTVVKECAFSAFPEAEYFQNRVFSAFAFVIGETEKYIRTICHESPILRTHPPLFVTLSAPWYISQARHIHIAHPKPLRLREEDIVAYADKEYEAFLSSPIVKEFDGGDIYESFERRVVQVCLNGYETAHPAGKEAKTVDMSVVFSIMSSNVSMRIHDELKRVFSGSDISISTFPLAVFDTVRRIGLEQQDSLLLDIAGEVSELTLVKGGTLAGSVSFPIGKATLIRHIAQTLHLGFDEAVSAVRLYTDNDMSKAEAKRMGTILTSVANFWVRPFEHALNALGQESVVFPRTIYMTADEDVAPWFSSLVKAETMNMFTHEGSVCSIITIDTMYLHTLYRMSDGVESNIFLILSAIFASRFVGTTPPKHLRELLT